MTESRAKCAICSKKDSTARLLMPCKCNRWVHRTCLDKRRIASATDFDKCPVCGAIYNVEKKPIPMWRKYAEIYLSVVRDLIGFILLLILTSIVVGNLLFLVGVKSTFSPTLTGFFVVCGVIGLVGLVIGLSQAPHNGFLWMNGMDRGGEGALIGLVIIGIIVILVGGVYWAVTTAQERIKRHERAVGVKEKVVIDYGGAAMEL